MSKIADIHEVLIYCGSSVDDQYKVLETMLEELPELKDDSKFHYLYEVGYFLIRFDSTFISEDVMREAIRKIDYVCEYHTKWIEQSDAVKDNWQFFCKYLNMVCMLALDTTDDYEKIYERITNLTFEAFTHHFYKEYKVMLALESRMLTRLGVNRAFTDGYFIGKREKND